RVGTVLVAGEKMAKSTGNLVLVHDLLERWSPDVLRLLILDRRWDEPWEFREGDLDGAAARIEELWRAAARAGGSDAATEAAVRALLDDLDVPRALSVAEEAGGRTTRAVAAILGFH